MITIQTGPQPTDLSDVRATNRAVVLRYVRTHSPCSRADIAARTGLNKATVSSLVTELIERRLLRETGLTENRVGRPATMLVLDGEPYAALGMQVDADELVVVAVDLGGKRLLTWRRAFGTLDASPPRPSPPWRSWLAGPSDASPPGAVPCWGSPSGCPGWWTPPARCRWPPP
ncbi:MarR family transcriptional regulator [Micromonospora echinospora]|uniref:MarR family transcriptional regulator n=1 Tax=Micromonospora echinospora TaxID=1877 RepID=UPI003A873E52